MPHGVRPRTRLPSGLAVGALSMRGTDGGKVPTLQHVPSGLSTKLSAANGPFYSANPILKKNTMTNNPIM